MTSWTHRSKLICPDCGHVFGERTTAGSINPPFSSREPAECRHKGGTSPEERRCPRLEEALAEAEVSERTK